MEKMKKVLRCGSGKAGKVGIGMLVVVTASLMLGVGYLFVKPAKATGLSNRKVTLQTSAPGVPSQQTVSYTSTNAVTAGQTIRIGYTDAWTIPTTFTAADFAGTTGMTVVAACGAGTDEVTVSSSNTNGDKNVTLTVCSGDTVPAGSKSIVIGTATGTRITNPTKVAAAGTADIYRITIGGTQTDSGDALVAIIEGVAVSVTVSESLSFSIAGVAAASCTEGGSATAVTTTATTVPFGTISTPNAFFKGCHDLTVSTNAGGGYAITVEEDTSLNRTGAGDLTIDDTGCDSGPCTEVIGATTTAPWATATNNGFGYTCSGTACNTEFASATEFNQFACRGVDADCDPGTGNENKQTPISSTGPVNNQTSRIVYKLSVSGVQPAGTYDNTITYIATPTF